ncbi:hypothetical protein CMV_009187 [Castanea mollissima]|uniref:Uncharacterized protein n=1 Tax=Castanea mollissima TaxID=60419 RepID=A0A8J4W1L1_9ROSI|nr:hypothetical protein CMV_009187 [Castanea mollissima]
MLSSFTFTVFLSSSTSFSKSSAVVFALARTHSRALSWARQQSIKPLAISTPCTNFGLPFFLPPEFAFSISETLSSPQRKGSSSETWSFLLSLLTDLRGNLSTNDEPQNLEVEKMSSYLLTVLTKKLEVDAIIRDTIDKVLVLRFGRASDPVCLQLDDILSKSAREVSKFASVALVDIDSNEI